MNKRQLLLSFPVVFLLVACGGKPQQPEPPSLMEASRQELATALGERDELLSMVKEISSTMNRIKHLENVVSLAPAQSGETPRQPHADYVGYLRHTVYTASAPRAA